MEALETARLCAKYADDKKAQDIVLLDLRGLSPVTDFFVICSAISAPQLRAVRDEVVEQMREQHGMKPLFVDGSYESQWLIVNFPNVLVHIQSPEKREYYALEELWGDAPTLPWQQEADPGTPSPSAPKRAAKKAAAKKAAASKRAAKKAPAKKSAAKVAKKTSRRKKA
ncbi:MAG: ribosome silencing factor [Prosthecobacter sp.]|jgi:ribosome-associated protein|nr:ribosome silencing factor [Prosthecobacter sp.]